MTPPPFLFVCPAVAPRVGDSIILTHQVSYDSSLASVHRRDPSRRLSASRAPDARARGVRHRRAQSLRRQPLARDDQPGPSVLRDQPVAGGRLADRASTRSCRARTCIWALRGSVLALDDKTWESLYALSTQASEGSRPVLSLDSLDELATIKSSEAPTSVTPEARRFFDAVNAALARSVDKDLTIYVHGANTNRRDCDGAGRAISPLHRTQFGRAGFAWPSAGSGLRYFTDVRNARLSVPVFARLIDLLTRHTAAEHINVLAYSAGAQIVSPALAGSSRPCSRVAATPARGWGKSISRRPTSLSRPSSISCRATSTSHVESPCRRISTTRRSGFRDGYMASRASETRSVRTVGRCIPPADRRLRTTRTST